MAETDHRLALVGAFLSGDGYPHPTRTMQMLRAKGALDLARAVERRSGAWGGSRVSRLLAAVSALSRLIAGALISVLRWCGSRRAAATVYVAYPAVPTLLAFSLLPRGCRPPRLVADAFVGWYDAAVVDRRLFAPGSLRARALRALERRAFAVADLVVADTIANARCFATELELPPEKFVAAPLAVFEREKIESRAAVATFAADRPARVLFVGTFVPLQGLDTLAAAIAALSTRDDIAFDVVGDGQSADAFADATAAIPRERLRWHRGFLPLADVRARVAAADLCIGVIGAGAKAARVWPLKNYLYAEIGKPIVTSERFGLPAPVEAEAAEAFALVPPGDAPALARAIAALIDDPERRDRLARRARAFYESHLSNDVAAAALERILFDGRR